MKQEITQKANQIFERTEKKYIVSAKERETLFHVIGDYFIEDEYGHSTVCNIYFDTPTYRLIRDSMEKPVYKEKLRLRSYGIPSEQSTVFLELKKKYKGIVYKRREKMTLSQAKDYIYQHKLPFDTQIMKEINYSIKTYEGICPAAYISYDRDAYYCKQDHNLRLTFDHNLLFRKDHLNLEDGIYGTSLLKDDSYIMEIKALNSMPLWLTNALNELEIFPASFSKYGSAYKEYLADQFHPVYKENQKYNIQEASYVS